MVISENGKKYHVTLRSAYQHIKSEQQLRRIVDASIAARYGQNAINRSFFDKAHLLGIVNNSRPL